MKKILVKTLTLGMAGMLALASPVATISSYNPFIMVAHAEEVTITPDISWYDAQKTEFEISTVEQLFGLAQLVKAKNSFTGCTIKLTQNINLQNMDFTPIGTNMTTMAFKGIFDGNNHTISNLYINRDSANAGSKISGLFGAIVGTTSNPAGIKNLILDGVIVQENLTDGTKGGFKEGTGVGALLGSGASVIIENCHIKNASVNSDFGNTGGIFGFASGSTVTNCSIEKSTVNGTVNSGLLGGEISCELDGTTASKAGIPQNGYINKIQTITVQGTVTGTITATGGLLGVAYNQAGQNTISDVIINKDSNIEGIAYVGGIIGSNQSPLSSCKNYAVVKGSSNIVSGIATAFSSYVSYKNCINYGNIEGVGCVAGIACVNEQVLGATNIPVENCYNLGTVTTTDTTSTAGGIVYNPLDTVKIFNVSNSYNMGEVKNSSGNVPQFEANDTYTNVYYNTDNASTAAPEGITIGGITGYTAAQFADRTVVDLLNANKGTNLEWYQNIQYPDFASNMTLSNLVIESENLSMDVNTTKSVGASVALETTNSALSYSSADTNIATVDSTGIITAVAAGTTDITVKVLDTGETKTVHITINTPVSFIDVTADKTTVKVGETVQVNTTITPTDATNKTVSYTSSDTKVATVDDKGTITAVAAGTANIIVKCGNIEKTIAITVEPAIIEVTSIDVKVAKTTLEIGENTQLTATVAPANATNKTVNYTSSNSKIATVNNKGVVTAVAAGTVTITAKSGAIAKEITITVNAKKPVLKLNASKATIYADGKNSTTTLSLTADNKKVNSTKATWKSSNTKVATVNNQGVITGKKAGSATITATYANVSVNCKVTVKKQTGSISASKATLYTKGTNHKLTLTFKENGSKVTASKVTWKSNSTKVATVSNQGVITGKKTGSATITASYNGQKFTCKVTVKTPTLNLKKSKVTIKKGKKTTITYTITPKANVQFKSLNTKIATVNSKGVVTGKKAGTVKIKVTGNEITKYFTVVVTK